MIVFVILLVSEMVLAFAFSVVSQIFYKKLGLDFKSIFKGFFERVFLVISLYYGYSQALTFFSALKLATRLKHTENSSGDQNKFNDFYLIGNLVSVSVAIGYVELLKYFSPKP